ncbi:hypothetical protein [Algihabitans albus]|uniref:hypothetical protein n=1 Tax=Algihabitans albus TaxID=2164067 RepID=UPI001F2F14B8|nr:hypothetical protein [Algihabitans albus]
MIPPKTAVAAPHSASCDPGEFAELRRRDDLPRIFNGRFGPFSVEARLIARRLQFFDPLPKRRIIQIGDAAFDSSIETL